CLAAFKKINGGGIWLLSTKIVKENQETPESTSMETKSAAVERVTEVGRDLYFGKTQGCEAKDLGASDNQKEDLPRLPPVERKSEAKSFNIPWEENMNANGPGPKILNSDNAYLISGCTYRSRDQSFRFVLNI
ncbi:UNVERIFIED_CONTAM: hypothetical protein Sangu_3242200, partial [Sesamum angustifolium]